MCEIRSEILLAGHFGHFGEGYSRGKHHCSENCFEDSLCVVKEQLAVYSRNYIDSVFNV